MVRCWRRWPLEERLTELIDDAAPPNPANMGRQSLRQNSIGIVWVASLPHVGVRFNLEHQSMSQARQPDAPSESIGRVTDHTPWSYTLMEAARITGLSIATLRRHEKAGRLTFHRVGRRTLVSAASLRALLGVEA